MRGSICGWENAILYFFHTPQVVTEVLNISSLYGTDMHMGFNSVSLLCICMSTHKCMSVRMHTHTHKTTFIISISEMQHYNTYFLLSVKLGNLSAFAWTAFKNFTKNDLLVVLPSQIIFNVSQRFSWESSKHAATGWYNPKCHTLTCLDIVLLCTDWWKKLHHIWLATLIVPVLNYAPCNDGM